MFYCFILSLLQLEVPWRKNKKKTHHEQQPQQNLSPTNTQAQISNASSFNPSDQYNFFIRFLNPPLHAPVDHPSTLTSPMDIFSTLQGTNNSEVFKWNPTRKW